MTEGGKCESERVGELKSWGQTGGLHSEREREENVRIDGLVLSCGGLCQRVVYCACYGQASEGPMWWWVDAQVCLG